MTSTRIYVDDDGDRAPHSHNRPNPNPKLSSTPRPPPTIGTNPKERPTTSVVPPRRLYEIHAPLLFNSFERTLVEDRVVYVDRDRGVILGVCKKGEVGSLRGHDRNIEVEKIEMGPETILLPGFVDVHVHLFLHPYSETTWEDQVTRESLAERTVRSTVHARKTLQAGFTTVRDLGTEGAFDADIGLRKCLAGRKPIVPGPRYYCSTRAIVATGAYGPKNRLYPAQDGVDGVMGAVPVDGVDACVREVRRQIGAGADWIKIYADYSPRSLLSPVSSSLATTVIQTFNATELKAMIDAAHQWNVKVAVHASSSQSINTLMDLVDKNTGEGGPDSIEHGPMMSLEYNDDDEIFFSKKTKKTALEKLAGAGERTTWVPTLAVHYTVMKNTGTKLAKSRWEMCQRTFKIALGLSLSLDEDSETPNTHRKKVGIPMDNIAVGGDTGPFPHGDNALEMVLMRQLGAPWEKVLSWATLGGWKCVRGMEWDERAGEERVSQLEKIAERTFSRILGSLEDDDPTQKEEMDDEAEEPLELDRGVPFGAIRHGWAADLVVIQGKLDGTPGEFEEALFHGVSFVMKGGIVYRNHGQEVFHLD